MVPCPCYRALLLPVAALLLLALLTVGSASGLAWERQPVAQGYYPSLALDGGDMPRISFSGHGSLKYAEYNGSAWTNQTVDDARSSPASSLEIDAAGAPRIAYAEAGTINPGLYYTARNGGAWTIEHIVTVDVDGSPSLVLGPDGPRIAYVQRWTAGKGLWYTSRSGTAWEGTKVFAGSVSDYSSLASAGARLYFSYSDEDTGDLKYAAYDGSTWSSQAVDTAGDVGEFSSIALDPSLGYPRIAYYDRTNGDLKYASWGGSSSTGYYWAIQTVDTAGDVGQYASLAMNSNGFPRIAYYDATNSDLKYASYDGTSWTIETVDAAGDTGKRASIKIGRDGRPRIAYQSGDSLKFARAVPSAPAIDVKTGVSVDVGATWQDADAAPGPSVVAGRPVGWRYVVTNTGNVPLSGVYVDDDRGVPVTVPKTVLGVGESMTATANGTAVAGAYQNVGTAYGTYASLTVQDSDGANYLGLALLAVPPGLSLPMDTNGDGLCDDVNGNGRKDFADVVLYFNQMIWIATNEPTALFDYNANGRIDFADVVWLFNAL